MSVDLETTNSANASHCPARHVWHVGDELSDRAARIFYRRTIELAVGIVGTVAVFAAFNSIQASFAAALWCLVLVVMRSDLDTFLIPDTASLAIALLGMSQLVTTAALDGRSVGACVIDLTLSLASGISAAAFLWTIGLLFRLTTGRDGLGFGDVKLFGALGVWLALQQQAAALELAAIAAIAFAGMARWGRVDRPSDIIPFGAFLAPMAWLVHVVDLFRATYWQTVS